MTRLRKVGQPVLAASRLSSRLFAARRKPACRQDCRPHMAILTILLTSTLAGAITLSEWRYRKPIPLTPGSAVAVVKIDRDVYIAARPDLADLRVRRDGEEIPYVLETLDATSQQREQSGEILDQSVVPGVGLHFTVRLTAGFRHNHVRLATSEVNFRQAVN